MRNTPKYSRQILLFEIVSRYRALEYFNVVSYVMHLGMRLTANRG